MRQQFPQLGGIVLEWPDAATWKGDGAVWQDVSAGFLDRLQNLPEWALRDDLAIKEPVGAAG